MSKTLKIFWPLMLCVLLLTGNSFAIGLGAYVDLGGGSGEAEYDFEDAEEFDINTGFLGLGFQLETSPLAEKKVFSYRFQAGIESRNIEDEDDVTLELGGIVINNTFAFGKNVSEKIRLWGGPQILIGGYSGETDKEFEGDEISFSGIAVGIGVAGGANFGLGNGKTILTTTVGLRSLGISGQAEWSDEEEGLNGSATEFYFTVGVLFGK